MVERFLYDVLKTGIDWFLADTRRVSTFYERELGLDAAEAAKARTVFEADGGSPTVLHSYPRTSGPFPCWAIVLAGDALKQKYLGDDLGQLDEEDELDELTDLDGKDALGIAIYVSYQYDIFVYAQDSPDLCLWSYSMLRWILLQNLSEFHTNGMHNVEWTGQDLMPDPRYMPENLWTRRLRLSFEAEERAYESKLKIRTVDAFVAGEPGETDRDGLNVNQTRGIEPYQE